MKNSYHGYGIQNFLEVNPCFGTNKDLKSWSTQSSQKRNVRHPRCHFQPYGNNWAYPGDYPYYYRKGALGPFKFGFWREIKPEGGFQRNDAVWSQEFIVMVTSSIMEWRKPRIAILKGQA